MFKSRIFFFFFVWVSFHAAHAQNQGVSINADGASPDASAILDVNSQERGILIPRMTESERLAMPALAQGLTVYQTDGNEGFWVFNGAEWSRFPIRGQNEGDIQYWDGTQWVMVPGGSPGNVLTISDTGIPVWAGLEPVGSGGYGVLPVVATDGVDELYSSYAVVTSRVFLIGGTQVTDHGVCFSTTPNPTISDQVVVSNEAVVQSNTTFTSHLDLTYNTTYYLRAFAINQAGIGYGPEISFTTDPGVIVVETKPASEVGATFIIAGGAITEANNIPVVDYGICWGTSPQPTIASGDYVSTLLTQEDYESHIIGLEPGTTYYIRAYGTTGIGSGTFYGEDVVVTTNATLIPAVGETFGGGVVFYVDGSGEHGLIAALGNFGSSPWGCSSSSAGASGIALGTGQSNTTAIVNSCSEPGIPARICDDLVHEGYNDWYLPSKAELTLLSNTTNQFQHWNAGGPNFSAWSSSEATVCSPGCAYFEQKCYPSACGGVSAKANSHVILPVRSF